jgi:hypothetical protein
MSNTSQIVGCFILFLISIVVFACVYYALYRRSPGRFLFGSDIRQSQRDAFAGATAAGIARLEAAIEALDHWAAELQAGAPVHSLSVREAPVILASGRLTQVEKWTLPISPSGFSDSKYVCAVWDPAGRLVTREDLPVSRLLHDFSEQMHREEQTDRAAKLEKLRAQLKSVTLESPFVWSFLDFLYFSAITQTTVGYGDILPNATAVRMVVVLQILVSYAVLVVLLNVVLSGGVA